MYGWNTFRPILHQNCAVFVKCSSGVPGVFQRYTCLYIYIDMTYIYIYIGLMSKTCPGTLEHPFDTSTYGVRFILGTVSHWTFAPNVRAYTTHTTLAYPPPPVPIIHLEEFNCL